MLPGEHLHEEATATLELLLSGAWCCCESGTCFFGGFRGLLICLWGPSFVVLGSQGSKVGLWMGSMVVGVVMFTSLLSIFVFAGYGEAAVMFGWLSMDWRPAWVGAGATGGGVCSGWGGTTVMTGVWTVSSECGLHRQKVLLRRLHAQRSQCLCFLLQRCQVLPSLFLSSHVLFLFPGLSWFPFLLWAVCWFFLQGKLSRASAIKAISFPCLL